MNKTQHSNALLVEIVIAVLIFALASTVILNVFGVTYAQSTKAGLYIDALGEAQSLADTLYAADDAEAVLIEEGFAPEDGMWTLEREDYTVTVTLNETPDVSGTWRETRVTVSREGETAVELPCSRYIPEEAAR